MEVTTDFPGPRGKIISKAGCAEFGLCAALAMSILCNYMTNTTYTAEKSHENKLAVYISQTTYQALNKQRADQAIFRTFRRITSHNV